MTVKRNHRPGYEQIGERPSEAMDPELQTGKGDLVNARAARARWGPETGKSLWLVVMGFGVLFLSVLILAVALGFLL